MIQEARCSFEISKLLKEKGFNERCIYQYYADSLTHKVELQCIPLKIFGTESLTNTELNGYKGAHWEYVSAPTHQMAMAWLREEKNLWCEITWEGKNSWCSEIFDLIIEEYIPNSIEHNAHTYEEAVESALRYSLKNLI